MFDYSTVDLDAILARAYSQMSPSQRSGVGHARQYGRHIFRAKMGLGKTFEMLTCVLCYKPQICLIVVSGKNAINTWRQELKKWYPEFGDDRLFNHVRGTAAQRKALYQRTDCLFYVTTAGSFIRDVGWLMDSGFRPGCLVIDEPHKIGLRNRKSEGFKAFKAFTARGYTGALRFIGMTSGTLTSKGAPQLWSYLHIMDPQLFRGYWPFVNMYCNVINGAFGREILGPKNTDGLAKAIAPYIYTVPDDIAEQELPPLRRIPLLCDLDARTAARYKTIAEQLYYELEDGGLESISTILAAYTKLRQLICCPRIIDPALGFGSPIESVWEQIIESREDSPLWAHNIIFTPFTGAIEHYQEFFRNQGINPAKIFVLRGGDEPEHVQYVETQFRKDMNSMVICSIQFSQSFNLESAYNMYFPHFDWDQDNNAQAEGRGRRRTSDKDRTIMAYYVSAVGTITEEMFDILNAKVRTDNATYEGVRRLRQALKNIMGDQ